MTLSTEINSHLTYSYLYNILYCTTQNTLIHIFMSFKYIYTALCHEYYYDLSIKTKQWKSCSIKGIKYIKHDWHTKNRLPQYFYCSQY